MADFQQRRDQTSQSSEIFANMRFATSESIKVLVTGHLCTPLMNSQPWDLKRFKVRRVVGRGYASRVYECLDLVSNTNVALKVYHKADLCPLNYHQIKREMLIQSSFSHPNILGIYAAFADSENVYMVLEFAAKGDLYHYLRHKGRRLTERQAAKYVVAPFIQTLQHLHGHDVVHRDIKPENLLLNEHGVVKLADFGLSILHTSENPVTRVGTMDYMAPEVVVCPRKRTHDEWKDRADLKYGPSVDVWALGVLVYELLVGYPPFKAATKEEIQANILQREPEMPDCMSAHCADFVRACLQKDPKTRKTIAQLAGHPWICDFIAAEGGKPAKSRSSITSLQAQVTAVAVPPPAAPRATSACSHDSAETVAEAGKATGSLMAVDPPRSKIAVADGADFDAVDRSGGTEVCRPQIGRPAAATHALPLWKDASGAREPAPGQLRAAASGDSADLTCVSYGEPGAALPGKHLLGARAENLRALRNAAAVATSL